MDVCPEPKVKYFTKVINKVQLEVIVQMDAGRIKGIVHVHPEHRLLDELNDERAFLPLTDVEVEGLGKGVRTKFLALRKDCIIYVIPIEEIRGSA
jgi:hypothetical protein